jgi:cytochrome c oxidase cbb3-type subunit 3/ubiquinol-cytochrome c reductase cytochrome c subunit
MLPVRGAREAHGLLQDMTRRPLLATLLVLVACIGGGTLQCTWVSQTPVQSQGGALYGRMCSVCHGRAGQGYRADEAPALRHPQFLGSATDDFLRNAIMNGRHGTTMSAWANVRGGPLSRTEVDAVVAFIRTWDQPTHPVLDERPNAGNAANGLAIFEKECIKCHGVNGTAGPNVHIGNPELLSSASNGFLRHAIRMGRRGTTMPGFEAKLGDEGVEDVVALLRKWLADSVPPPPPPPAKPPPIPLGPVPLNPSGPEPIGFKAWPGTTPADVIKAQMDRHVRVVLLDARAPSDYTYEHLAGAVSVPFYDPDPYFAALPKDVWLVAYCACPHAESGQLAQRLTSKGFKKVTVLDEGLGFWKSKGYGTSKGLAP